MTSPQRIDSLLPQTQCRKCGYPSCFDYANAIASGDADINRCPPGGEVTLHNLAQLLGREAPPLDTSRGKPASPPHVAWIQEADCIGCTKCLQACPVDAILGTAKRMHTIIATECTGCELCISRCPVDCIILRPAARDAAGNTLLQSDPERARHRFQRRRNRISESFANPTTQRKARQKSPLVVSAMAEAEKLLQTLNNKRNES